MGKFDQVYNKVVHDVIQNGIWDKDQNVRTVWKDGTPAHTKSLISVQMKIDNSETALLTTKFVPYRLPIEEILAFFQQKTNDFSYFHEKKIHFWDEWMVNEGEWAGTIGPAYGYQMGLKVREVPNTTIVHEMVESGYLSGSEPAKDPSKVLLDQTDYLLYQLKVNPASRRHVTSLWNIHDLDEMALNPCVWHTQWIVKEDTLHLVVGARSNDLGLGNPFNVFQYQTMQRMIAQVTGYKVGTFTFNINDAHVYERHIEPLKEQITRPSHPAPTLLINPDVKSLYDFTIDDFTLLDYTHGERVKMEVAI